MYSRIKVRLLATQTLFGMGTNFGPIPLISLLFLSFLVIPIQHCKRTNIFIKKKGKSYVPIVLDSQFTNPQAITWSINSSDTKKNLQLSMWSIMIGTFDSLSRVKIMFSSNFFFFFFGLKMNSFKQLNSYISDRANSVNIQIGNIIT